MLSPLPVNTCERPKLCYVYAREQHMPELGADDDNEEWKISIDRETLTEFAFLMRIVAPYYLYLASHRQFFFKGQPVESSSIQSPLLLRGHYSSVRTARKRMHPELQYNCQKSENTIYQWVSHLTASMHDQFIKRPLAVVTFGDVRSELAGMRGAFSNQDDRVFLRTQREYRTGFRFICRTKPDGSRGWWEWSDIVDVTEPCIVSGLVEFDSKRKYRCYVIDGVVSSVSRFTDYEFESCEERAFCFSQNFVDEFCQTDFPATFVMDIAETTDRGWVVLELHPLGSSARYVNNRFDAMVSDLYSIDCRMTDRQYRRFQLDVDEGKIIN